MTVDLLVNITLAFIFISLAILLANRLKYSSIPFLILSGILVSPCAPEIGGFSLSLVSNTESIEFMARLGVLLMMFYLGLEFPASRLVASGVKLIKGGTLYIGLNFVRGLVFGLLLFDTSSEAMVVAGITHFQQCNCHQTAG